MMTFKSKSKGRQEPLAQELQRSERLAPVQGGLAFGAVALTVLFTVHPAALAQSPGVNLASLAARVSTLEAHENDPGPKGPTGDAGPQGLPGNKGALGSPGTNGTNGMNGTSGMNGTTGATGAGYTAAHVALMNTLSLSGMDLTVSGVNVHVVDGTGSTNSMSHLGNLIIGYNAPSTLYNQARLGSHNVIIGDANNYSSYGGIVCGDENAVGAPYASVLGGTQNLANGQEASISGGYNNHTSGTCTAIVGGYGNIGQGYYAVVSGGNQNTATGEGSTVSGGNFNTVSSLYSSLSGGYNDNVSGEAASISGGKNLSDNYNFAWKGGNINTPNAIVTPTQSTFGSD